VAEQATFAHIMAGHTARYCLALADEYRVTQDPAIRRRALSGLNAVTYMQSDAGLFRTHFFDTKKKVEKDPATAPNWYSQHLYSVCHILESMPALPEIAPNGQNHILGSSAGLRDVSYASGSVRYASAQPAEVSIKLGFTPKSVQVAGKPLAALTPGKTSGDGWSFNPTTHVLTIRQTAGAAVIGK
jgi:hypothetical protein